MIKSIQISIIPKSIMQSSGIILHELRIEVHDWETGQHRICETIPEDDFESRFDYIVERGKNEIKNRVWNMRHKGKP